MANAEERAGGSPLSVGQWLALLVIVLFVGPLLISNLWGYLQSRRYLTAAAFRNTRDLAALEAAETADFAAAAAAMVPAVLTGDPRGRALVIEAAEGAATDGRAALASYLASAVATSAELDEVQVLTPGGELVASSLGPGQPGPDLASAVCLQRGRTEAAVLGFDPGGGREPELLVATPIAIEDRVRVVACARFRFAIYQRLLTTVDRRTAGARVFLIDRDRRVIATSTGGRIVASGDRLAAARPPASSPARSTGSSTTPGPSAVRCASPRSRRSRPAGCRRRRPPSPRPASPRPTS